MKILGINHVGLAPKDPIKANWFFKEALKIRYQGAELIASQKTNTHIFSPEVGSACGGLLEVLENQPGEDGPVKSFIEKRGGGIHHIALDVADIVEAINHLLGLGVEMIDLEPRYGACNTKIAFVHPRSTGGLLVELVESSK